MARGGGSRGGGGGRSFGGGGGRSFGGRSSSGSRGGSMGGLVGSRGGSLGGSGSLHRGGPAPGGLGRPNPPRHIHHPTPVPAFGWGRPKTRVVHTGGSGCLSGISSMFIVSLLVIVCVMVFLSQGLSACSNIGNRSGNITASTVKREALPRGSVVETGYYTDELNWIGNTTKLITGMKNFYQETGVQPYLYITDNINGKKNPTSTEVEAFAQAAYDSLFKDEAHMLLIFCEYEISQYHTWYLCGNQAKTVLDNEAMDILLDYIDRYYYMDYSDEEFFSQAFNDAGKRIMTKTTSPWIPVMVILGLVLLAYIGFNWWKKGKAQKNLEAEQTERILNTTLETFGSTDAEERAQKYEDKN